MNAAFLLVTTAWFAGADAAPTKPPEKIESPKGNAAPALVTADGGYGGGGCGGCECDSGCDDCGHGWKHRLRGLFHRNKGCDCGCEAATCCDSAPSCAPATCGCDTCDTCCHKEHFFHRLKARFHRSCGCCDTCDSCGGGTYDGAAPVIAPPKAEGMPKTEKIANPLPKGNEPPLKSVNLDSAPTVVPNVTVEAEKSPF